MEFKNVATSRDHDDSLLKLTVMVGAKVSAREE